MEHFVVVDGEPDGVRARGHERERTLYDVGAAAFQRGDWPAATAAFTAILALPREERLHRSTWAMFMLGRMGDDKAFARVRALVDDGFVDDLGLGAASLGEEARRLRERGDDAGAVTLYARQARLGGDPTSLLMVARDLVDDEGPARRRALKSPVVQRLLASFAANRSNDRASRIGAVVTDLAAIKGVAWPDRVASAAYQLGRFDVATRLARLDAAAPLSLWVQAKLAIRAGQNDDAARLLAQAARAFPVVAASTRAVDDEGDASGWPAERHQVMGDEALLALNRGDYSFALEKLLSAGDYWVDAAHVAERVLTVDELIAFVRLYPTLAATRDGFYGDDDTKDCHDSDGDGASDDTTDGNGDGVSDCDERQRFFEARTINSVLARRLVRVGRLQEARALVKDPAVIDGIDALIRLETRHDHAAGPRIDVDAAEALARAAWLMRTRGMELMGTELEPDGAVWGGAYEMDEVTAQNDDDDDDDDNDNKNDSKQQAGPGTDELARVKLSAAQPNVRYHYRRVAASMLEDAASHVPPRSQAFAALLCEASRAARRDDDEVQRLWRRYVAEGAVVDFTGAFGSHYQVCPDPDFDGARTFEERLLLRQEGRNRHGPSGWLLVLALLGTGGIVAFVVALARPGRYSARPLHPPQPPEK